MLQRLQLGRYYYWTVIGSLLGRYWVAFIAIAGGGGFHATNNPLQSTEVSFQWKNPDFLSRNPDFLLRNPDFLLKNVDFISKSGHEIQPRGEHAGVSEVLGIAI